MSRSHEERPEMREGVLLNTANNRNLNPVMSTSNLEKEKHDKQHVGKLNSGSEPCGYRAVDLMKSSNKPNAMPHHPTVGSAPLPPIPPLQAPLLTSILPGPNHSLIPPVLSHTPLLRGGTLPAQIPLMGKAAQAVAPPRASIVAPSLRTSASIPLLKSANSPSQIQIVSKGSSIFSPIVPSNRVPSSSPGSVLSRSTEHSSRVMDPKVTQVQSEMHQVRGPTMNPSSIAPIPGTATVQVIASGTASVVHPSVPPQQKSFPVIPSANMLKIGSSNPPHGSQPVTCMITNSSVSVVTTYKTVASQNNITISKFPQPILIPSTLSGTPTTTRSDHQDHPKVISSNANHGRHTPPVISSHHSTHSHYGMNISSYNTTSHQAHISYTTSSAPVESKNERLKPGNPSLQYQIGSYFPIEGTFSPSLGVHALAPTSQYPHRYVQAFTGNNSALGSFPMFVEGSRGFAAPLPIPGMSVPPRDSHHHPSPVESSIMNNSYARHNFPNLQPSNYHSSVSTTSSSRPGPGILRKRTIDGYAVHNIDRMSSPTKQELRSENRPEPFVTSRADSAPMRQDSPRLLCDEKGTFNDGFTSTADSSSNSNNTDMTSSITEIKRDHDAQSDQQLSSSLSSFTPTTTNQTSSHQHLISSAIPTTEASPRKKPRKQNVITTEDKYSSKVIIEEEEDMEYVSRKPDSRPETKKDGNIFRIQKPIPKLKMEENIPDIKDSEPPELDETSSYYNFIRKPKYNVLGDYKINTKAAYHHFFRYSDVKAKDEKKATSAELANSKKTLHNISGWRIHHVSSQMDDLCSLESEVCNKLFEFQRELPRPSKHYMITACHDIQNGKKPATTDEQLRVLHELIQGNIQRCQLSMEQIGEAKQTMLRVLDHKPKILDIIKRHKHKRTSKKKPGH
eukprot:gene11328-12514_t